MLRTVCPRSGHIVIGDEKPGKWEMVNSNIQRRSPASLRALERGLWTDLDDSRLLAQCHVDTYRASGPGGQKRNKTSSAVRLRHGPSGLMVIAGESRSQHENRARALRRLRRAFYLKLRENLTPEELTPPALLGREGYRDARDEGGRLGL